MKLIGSLPLNDGKQTGIPYFRKSRRHTFKAAGYPACKIAGMQESKNAGKTESLLSAYPACLMDGMTGGTNERPQSCLISYRNDCRTVVLQGSRQP
jgi:hypothetical protein